MKSDCAKIQQSISSLKDLKNKLEAGLSVLPDNRQLALTAMLELEKIKEAAQSLLQELDPFRAWQVYKNGEKICEYPYKNQSWKPCQNGIIIYDTDEGDYLLNGKKVLNYFNDDSEVFEASLKKRILIVKLLGERNVIYVGDKPVYRGADLTREHRFEYHPRGLVFEIGNQLLLNGKELLYEGELHDWHTVPRGVIVYTGKEWYFYNHWPVEEEN